jgi:hypothetical protein
MSLEFYSKSTDHTFCSGVPYVKLFLTWSYTHIKGKWLQRYETSHKSNKEMVYLQTNININKNENEQVKKRLKEYY